MKTGVAPPEIGEMFSLVEKTLLVSGAWRDIAAGREASRWFVAADVVNALLLPNMTEGGGGAVSVVSINAVTSFVKLVKSEVTVMSSKTQKNVC